MTKSKQQTTKISANTQKKSDIQTGVRSVLHLKMLCVTAGSLKVNEQEYLISNVYSSRHLIENNQCDTVMQGSSNTSE